MVGTRIAPLRRASIGIGDGALPVGELSLLLYGREAGITITSIASNMTLGGSNNPRSLKAVLETPNRPIKKALLDLTVLLHGGSLPSSLGFRVDVGYITVTREFKPNKCVLTDAGVLCKLVYDVTPILKSLSDNSSALELMVTYHGITPLTVASATSFFVLGSGDWGVKGAGYAYLIGPVVLEPGDSSSVELPVKLQGMYRVGVQGIALRGSYALEVRVGGASSLIKDVNGYFERAIVVDVQHPSNTIDVYHKEISAGAEKRPGRVVLHSLYIVKVVEEDFDADIDLLEVDKSSARLRIRMRGKDYPDNVMLVVMAVGRVIDRKNLSLVDTRQQDVHVDVKLAPGKLNTIRLIWRSLGGTRFKEVRIRG